MFVHLHTHSDFSPQDGAQSCKQIATRAAELGMPAVALTDHGRAGGLLQFKKECLKAGVKPIYGVELYVAPESRFTKEKLDNHSKTSYHLTVLAKNEEGLRNIFRLTSLGWLDGYYYKPRVDMELLEKHREGLVVLSGCGSGRLATYLMEDRIKEAVSHARDLQDVFKDDFYIEIQNHGLDWQGALLERLCQVAQKIGAVTVATQDSHYPTREDAELHNYICKLAAGDLSFDSDQSWFKSEEEMREMIPKSEDMAIDNTEGVADKCQCDWQHDKTIWPVYDLPEEVTPAQELRRLAEDGFKEFFGEGTQEYRDRLEYELKVIEEMGFPTYFLVVQDFINWAKDNGVPVGPGRGSGAGSLVCYCTGITEVDPIKYGLYFERFLNPARVSLPDIDVDFCRDRRDKVIEYVAEKYGADKIAQIGTYAQFKPRGSLRAFARVMGYDTSVGHTLANMIPPDVSGKQDDWEKIVTDNPGMLKTDWPDVVDMARKAEGLRNQAGVHAAGVVISDSEIKAQVPLFLGKGKEITTQFDMHDVEDIGLVKYDFLGLRNLTVIQDTINLIKEIHDVDIDFRKIEDGDKKVYNEIFKQGKLEGVFQFETSSGFKDLCMQVQPKSIEDLSTITALFRPGPLRTGLVVKYVAGRRNPEDIEYAFRSLSNLLNTTYGIMVYQEQIMKICTDVAGYTLPEADNMRKIIGKKLPEKMKLERAKFVEGCVKNGEDETEASKLFDDIEGFAAYSFNKAHSVAYSIISYRTAWLKAHYPHEFYTALLNSSMDNQEKMVAYIHAAREDGIPILPPDVNRSVAKFTLDEGTILFGLAGVKGIGEKAVEQIVEARNACEFGALEDLIKAKVKKNVLVALAECGALEEITELSRDQVKEHAEALIKHYKKVEKWEERAVRFEAREKEIRQAVAGGHKPPRRLPKLPPKPEFDPIEPSDPLTRSERIKLERKTLGFYLTGHPLDDYPGLMRLAQYTILDLLAGDEKIKDKQKISIPVVISSITKKRSSKGKNYAVITVEDCTGRTEATIFSRGWESLKGKLEEDMVGVLQGRVNKEESEEEDSPPIVRLSVSDFRVVETDVSSMIRDINITLRDGTTVIFKPNADQDVTTWQRAATYCDNLQRMGY